MKMASERVFLGKKEILLVGTAHISRKSVELVKQTIEKEKPEVVGVELDAQRYRQLKEQKKWMDTDLSKVVKQGQTYLFLASILLGSMQKKLGKELGVKPGAEMMEAIKISEEKGIPVGLLDRNIGVTLKRAFNAMGLMEKIKMLVEIVLALFHGGEQLTEEAVEKLKHKDTLNALMQEMSQKMPSVKKVLVDERDAFIANRITAMPGKKVMAVVGMGHIEGIKKRLGEKIDIAAISVAEKKKSRLKYIAYVAPVLLAVLLAYGFYSKGAGTAINIILLWFLINGLLSALGAALARAHPFSVATAFLAAPFTSLHPAFAAGWFAAAVEMKMHSPKVKDFHGLQKLESYGDFSRNRVTKVLLIAAYSNIGSTIGTIIALPYILSLLG